MSQGLAVITGASSGIGYELAKGLAERGFDLIVCSAGDRLEKAAADFSQFGVRVTEVSSDLATREGVDALWVSIEKDGRAIDVACINAGVGVGGLFDETDLDAELNMVELNCTGTIHLAKHVVRRMKRLGRGRILFTASIAGEMVAPAKRCMPPPRPLCSLSRTACDTSSGTVVSP